MSVPSGHFAADAGAGRSRGLLPYVVREAIRDRIGRAEVLAGTNVGERGGQWLTGMS